jgi:hypothetical protein
MRDLILNISRTDMSGRSLVLALLIAALASNTVLGQEPVKEPELKIKREIFVPFNDLHVLLEDNSDRVMMSRDEYQKLLASAKSREIKVAPLDTVVVDAAYSGRIETGVALISGKLIVEPLNEGLVQVPLTINGVALRSAKLGDEPANLWRNEQGEIVLLISGNQRQTLTLEMTVPVQASAARQSMTLQLPTLSATRFELTSPGNVEVKSGLAVISRTYDEEKNTTRFELLASREPMNLVMSLNNRLLKDDQVVVANSVLIHKLDPHVQELHVTTSLDVIHGALEQVQFKIPQGYQVRQVATELLNQWEIQAADDGDLLTVQLREPTREDIVLNIAAARVGGEISAWQVPEFRTLDVAGQISVIGILADVNLKVSNIESTGVIPIDYDFLRQAIPASVLAEGFSSPVSIIAAYYAPQADYAIKTNITAPPAELHVKSSSRLTIGDQELTLQGGVSLLSLFDSRFGFDLTLPENWRITEVTGADGQPIPFDRYEEEGQPRIHVRLPQRISNDQPTRVYFRASSTPVNWLDEWQTNSVQFPLVKIDASTRHNGAIAVSLATDLAVKPTETVGLQTLDEQDKQKHEFNASDTPLAYLFKSDDYKLTLDIERLQPLVSAKSYTFFGISPTQLNVHAELVYEVRQAKTDTFKFQLPLSAPTSISIQGGNCRLKDFRSEVTDSARQWIVQLSEQRTGSVQILVDFQQPLDAAQLATLELTPVVVDDVQFQTAMVAVEGSSELDVDIQTAGRAIDIGELSAAAYTPGRFLLGAYSWPAANGTLTVSSSRRAVFALPAAIVQRAELVTSISANGKSQTAARFQLVTDQPFLRVQLPANSSLWSIQLDGEPAKPQRHDQSLLISLIDKSTESQLKSIRDLQLVYESALGSVNLVGTIAPEAPSLWLHHSSDDLQGFAVPLVDMNWRLYLPEGYQISRADGNFQSKQLSRRPSMVKRLGFWIYSLGGGIDRNHAVGMDLIGGTKFEQSVSNKSAAPMQNYHDTYNSDDIKTEEMIDRFSATEFEDKEMILGIADEAESPRSGRTSGDVDQERNDESALPAKKPQAKTPGQLWALSGLRSLDIELTATGNSIDFFSLGNDSRLQATVVHNARIQWLAIAVALLIGLFGVLLTHRSAGLKLRYVIIVILVASLLPLTGSLFDAIQPVADLALLAGILVGLYFLLVAIFKRFGNSANLLVKTLPMLMLSCALIGTSSQPMHAQEVVKDMEQLRQLIEQLQHQPELKLPADAIIIPFNPDDPEGRENASKLLLPYEHYIQLIEKSDADKLQEKTLPPVNYVLASARYTTELTLDEDLVVQGSLVIELLSDDPISISLPLDGGALSQASVNGKPAKLQFLTPTITEQPQQQQQLANAAPQPAVSNVVMLHLEGKGRKNFDFTVRMKLERQGGWRSVQARLPVGITRGVDIQNLNEATEIRLSADADQRSVEAKAGEKVESVLNADGTLRLQWKPSTAARVIDQSLTVLSEAIFDVREDGLRLAWRVDLDFRGSERDAFSLQLPTGFLVERVTGDNIRAWEIKQQDEVRQLDVTLLSAVKDRETFMVELSQRDFAISSEVKQFDVPYLSVEGAALQKGMYTIRRSPIIELKTLEQRAANRIDANQAECKIDVKSLDAVASPLGIAEFQCLQFATTPFQIRLQAVILSRKISAESQTIFRIGQTEADFETRINYKIGQRPIYELSFELPASVEIEQVSAGQNETWTIEKLADQQLVHIWFPRGVSGDLPLLVNGSLSDYSGQAQWPIPALKLNDAETQTGQIAVQVDPALTLTADNLQNCDTSLVQQLESWLNPDQRGATRLALRTRGADYAATLNFTKIPPRVSVETVTNVRLTFFAIEETILLDFDIQQAGIRQIKFLLPQSLQNARINAQLVREKTIQPAAAPNQGMIQVTLDLQDEVMETYRVVIENDRQLADADQVVPMPIVETGETVQRYVTLQNAGRDELKVIPGEEFERLHPQLSQYAKLAQKIGGGEMTMAYMAKKGIVNPTLTYGVTQRQAVDTVAASIEFAKTMMVVDSSGAYRALQNFQVNNRSEQYLDVQLPAGARLLTVLVQGYPVKPVAWPTANNDQKLRIPLVKTPAGDLDYPVQLKYAGTLGKLSPLKEIDFPVIETLNIKVQLSQLHLRLPESHRWGDFGGTMTRVDSRGELEEGFLAYKNRQIQQLVEQVQLESLAPSSYSNVRVQNNLKKLEQELQTYRANEGREFSGEQLQQQLELNEQAIQSAQSTIIDSSGSMNNDFGDNRGNFNKLFAEQKSKIARNTINKNAPNFDATPDDPSKAQITDGKAGFDKDWFARNSLESSETQTKPGGKDGDKPANDMPIEFDSGKQNADLRDESINYSNPQGQQEAGAQYPNQPDANQMNAPADPAMQIPQLDDDVIQGFAQQGWAYSINGGRSQIDGTVVSGKADSVLTAGLASLDIALPERGVDYFFKSPRGNVTVTARSVRQSSISHWISLLAIIGLCLLSLLVCRIVCRFSKSKVWKWIGIALLGILGLYSLANGTLPVYGAIALIAAISLVVEKFVRLACSSNAANTNSLEI